MPVIGCELARTAYSFCFTFRVKPGNHLNRRTGAMKSAWELSSILQSERTRRFGTLITQRIFASAPGKEIHSHLTNRRRQFAALNSTFSLGNCFLKRSTSSRRRLGQLAMTRCSRRGVATIAKSFSVIGTLLSISLFRFGSLAIALSEEPPNFEFPIASSSSWANDFIPPASVSKSSDV